MHSLPNHHRKRHGRFLEARSLIEPEIAALAAKKATPKQIEELRQHLEREHDAPQAGHDSDAIRLSALFHSYLAKIAGHSIFASFVSELLPRSSLIIAPLLGNAGKSHARNDAHHALVNAIENMTLTKRLR